MLFLLCNFFKLCHTNTCEGSIRLDFILIGCVGMTWIKLILYGVRFTAFNIISVVLSGVISRHLFPISHFSFKNKISRFRRYLKSYSIECQK